MQMVGLESFPLILCNFVETKKQTTIHHLLFLHPLGSGGIGKGGKQFPKYEFQPPPTKKTLLDNPFFKRGNNDYINIL